MAKEPLKTRTIGETAPAAERVQLGAPALSAAAEASAADATVIVSNISEAAALLDAPEVIREVPGPGVGAERVAERVERVEDRAVTETAAVASVLPAAPLIDPDDVSGRRRVEAATRITHDGVDYAPDHADPDRRSLLLDFRQYWQLAAIGAVIPLSSRDLRDWAGDED